MMLQFGVELEYLPEGVSHGAMNCNAYHGLNCIHSHTESETMLILTLCMV